MKLNEWKNAELNRLLSEKWAMKERTCNEIHPNITHEAYLEEQNLEEAECSATYNRDKDK